MSDGLTVDPQELRSHAGRLRGVHDRFEAIRTASGHIFQADGAYGELCQWLPPILEERHMNQDAFVEAIAYNIDALAQSIDDCATAYEDADDSAGADFDALGTELDGGFR